MPEDSVLRQERWWQIPFPPPWAAACVRVGLYVIALFCVGLRRFVSVCVSLVGFVWQRFVLTFRGIMPDFHGRGAAWQSFTQPVTIRLIARCNFPTVSSVPRVAGALALSASRAGSAIGAGLAAWVEVVR